jgi:PAS domain S-box-containing protein
VQVADSSVGGWGTGAAPAVDWGLLCSIDSRRYFTALGQGWEDMLGWTREELFSRPFTDFVHPADRDATLASIQAAWQGDSATVALETRFRVRGGHWQRVRWSPLPDRAELHTAARASASPAPGARRDRPVARAAVRVALVLVSVCAAVVLGYLLTSFAPQGTVSRPPLASQPAGMDGPVTRLGPVEPTPGSADAPPGLVGAPLSSSGAGKR